jgi:hypothetical protein
MADAQPLRSALRCSAFVGCFRVSYPRSDECVAHGFVDGFCNGASFVPGIVVFVFDLLPCAAIVRHSRCSDWPVALLEQYRSVNAGCALIYFRLIG